MCFFHTQKKLDIIWFYIIFFIFCRRLVSGQFILCILFSLFVSFQFHPCVFVTCCNHKQIRTNGHLWIKLWRPSLFFYSIKLWINIGCVSSSLMLVGFLKIDFVNWIKKKKQIKTKIGAKSEMTKTFPKLNFTDK